MAFQALTTRVYDAFADWGTLVMDAIVAFGGWVHFSFRTISWLVRRLPRRETLMPNFYEIGVLSLPVVALDRNVYWDGPRRPKLLSVSATGAGDSVRWRH